MTMLSNSESIASVYLYLMKLRTVKMNKNLISQNEFRMHYLERKIKFPPTDIHAAGVLMNLYTQ